MLDGSCTTPIAGHAEISSGVLQFRGLIVKPDGSAAHQTSVAGSSKDAVTIGADSGRALRQYAGPGFFDIMRIVVTRPQEDGERTAATLARARA